MVKVKKELTAEQKKRRREAKKERQKKFEWIFINGKQVKKRREPTIDGLSYDEFYLLNADPITLAQNGDYEILEERATVERKDDEDLVLDDRGLFDFEEETRALLLEVESEELEQELCPDFSGDCEEIPF